MYPKMRHVTCVAHGFHRVAEEVEVRSHFPSMDYLISNLKKVFLKAPYGIAVLKEVLPNTTLPPQPILTSCRTSRTWLEFSMFLKCITTCF